MGVWHLMDLFPLIVSYYTKETMYQLEIRNLIESCERWALNYHIEAIDSLGSWELNCGYKPFFLFNKLQEFKRPLFWVDADGVFLKSPSILPQFSSDLSVRINASYPADHRSKVASGSIFVNATPQAENLLTLWASECYHNLSRCNRKEEYWDQVGLRDAIFSHSHQAKVENLPHEYVAIKGNLVDEKQILDPVIMHYQASRRYKKLINNLS